MTDDLRLLLNSIIDALRQVQGDLELLRLDMDTVRATQISHGKALEELKLRFDQFQWRRKDRGTPQPIYLPKNIKGDDQ